MKSSFHSSILVVGNPNPQNILLGVDNVFKLSEVPADADYPVIVGDTQDLELKNHIINLAKDKRHPFQFINIGKEPDLDWLSELRADGFLKAHYFDWNYSELQNEIVEALEFVTYERQKNELIRLYEEQNIKLRQLTERLEDSILEKQRLLTDSTFKSVENNKRLESILKLLVAVIECDSVLSIENTLAQELQTIGVDKVQIKFFEPHQPEEKQKSISTKKVLIPLEISKTHKGSLLFQLNASANKSRGLRRFLNQVTSVVSVALDRMISHKEAESISTQWDTTFKAITFPIMIIQPDFTVRRTNKGSTTAQTSKCYQLMFNREKPCVGCQKGQPFRLSTETGKTIDVTSQKFSSDGSTINIYRDISEDLEFQKSILEKARLAELGTIGSSIAHELNNPLAGIITVLQLAKAELKSSDDHLTDIIEMEKGALRAKEIIQNLLTFSKIKAGHDEHHFDVAKVLKTAIPIAELRSRSRGIRFSVNYPTTDCPLFGRPDLISQSILLILDLIFTPILRFSEGSELDSEIRLTLKSKSNSYVIEIENKSTSQDKPEVTKARPQFQLAKQNIANFKGDLDVSTDADSRSLVKITIPKNTD